MTEKKLSDSEINEIVKELHRRASIWYSRRYWKYEKIKQLLSEKNFDAKTYERCAVVAAKMCGI